ncbi:ciliary microtubule inner protein 2B-like [Diadema antillarum]|uniref:ciliary microtubule inner protein 2B-like n=1 Tax=Diadema antillarum TaxID=105358 RepID=UPI003A85E729
MAAVKQEKSVLTNPEPYHTPGYCGFCPQFKFQIGETFGRTTTRLLTDPKVPKSDRTLLSDLKPPKPGYPDREISAGRPALLQSRKASFGDQKFTEQMVPGYTGYIPKSQHFYGNRYAVICHDAVSNFESDQQVERKKKDDMKTIQCIQAGKLDASQSPEGASFKPTRTSPLSKVPGAKSGRFNFTSKKKTEHSLSPYYMSDSNPQKFFMSGYTGFVPNARGLTGMGYPMLTNRALIAFADDPNPRMARLRSHAAPAAPGTKGVECKASPAAKLPPVKEKILEDMRKLCGRQLPVIYPVDSGLVPHYTGHIPGQKFRYGTTFGHSTRNAKRDAPKPSTKSSNRAA